MSEEEKKAIETIKNLKDIKWYEHAFDSGTEILDEYEKKDIDIVLNLIDKQQKEIEELKEKNKRLEQDRNEYKEEYINLQNARYYNYISKDKIKEKINYYEERGYIEIASALKELLEGE